MGPCSSRCTAQKVFYLRNVGSTLYSSIAIPVSVNCVSFTGTLRATVKADRGAAQPTVNKTTDNNTNEILLIFKPP